jgi:transmembrane sensor
MLVKFLLGEASPAEEQSVRAWIEADVSHKKYFEQFQLIWDTSKQLALKSTVDENKAWEKFRHRVAKPIARKPKKLFAWTRIAAAIVILLGIGLVGYLLTNTQTPPKEISLASLDNTLRDTLPDGTQLTLNKKSTLSYPDRFTGDKREVTLSGEGFFDVTPDKKKPFIIQARDLKVVVVGTSFNIKEQPDSTEVIVETGIVQVIHRTDTVELKAGESIAIAVNGQPGTKQKVADKLYNYYRSKEFVCEETPLWKLVEVVNEAYNTNIIIGNDAIRHLPISTTFNNESLDQVLNVISLTFNITVIKKDDQVILQ